MRESQRTARFGLFIVYQNKSILWNDTFFAFSYYSQKVLILAIKIRGNPYDNYFYFSIIN